MSLELYLECFPCLTQQAVSAIQRVVQDAETQTAFMREALTILSSSDPSESPPVIAQKIHRALRQSLKEEDPYREIKDESNAFAISLLPDLRAKVAASSDPPATAARFAIAGNLIDYGPKRHISSQEIMDAMARAQDAPLDARALEHFREAIETAGSILYLADNAGEIVLDRLLIEQLPIDRVTLAVRGKPVINDATMVDARAAGLTELVRVIENGSDVPGTVLEQCSPAFLESFDSADMVISKGQGNLESLLGADKRIYFLVFVKCGTIARELACNVGDMVIRAPSTDSSNGAGV